MDLGGNYIVNIDPSYGSKTVSLTVSLTVGEKTLNHTVVLNHNMVEYTTKSFTFSQEKMIASWLKNFLAKRPGSSITLTGGVFTYPTVLPLGSITNIGVSQHGSDPWANIR